MDAARVYQIDQSKRQRMLDAGVIRERGEEKPRAPRTTGEPVFRKGDTKPLKWEFDSDMERAAKAEAKRAAKERV